MHNVSLSKKYSLFIQARKYQQYVTKRDQVEIGDYQRLGQDRRWPEIDP